VYLGGGPGEKKEKKKESYFWIYIYNIFRHRPLEGSKWPPGKALALGQ